jgi:GAF domain-containing protein
MITPPIPPNEIARLKVLRDLLILDTPAEDRLDIITEYAASIGQTPIALISLVDENRQWFKSKLGIDATETSREISFCGHAILNSEPLVVTNPLADERFSDNPLVTGAPNIRFYVGAPLEVNEQNIGTLCLIDSKPHKLDNYQLSTLKILAMLIQEVLADPTIKLEDVSARLAELTKETETGTTE